ncbi:MAG: hypothetical protein QM682_13310 [Paracoccus sp. (in: a-proteobacteria)]|uniref:hypothetical protein n=1 Tax=Paracoccus sp. TaxID=267 RepID=UPI0039E2650F
MKDDLNASEKRLIAALDRIDNFIDRATRPPEGDAPAALRAENQRLNAELAELREREAKLLAGFETRLAEANERLNAAGDEAAALAAANEALAEANRQLIAAQAGQGAEPAALAAHEAEIAALKAARAAEMGQMGDIIDSLDRMLAQPEPAGRAPVQVEAPVSPDPRVDATVTAEERD